MATATFRIKTRYATCVQIENAITPDYRGFLARRFRESSKGQPGLRELRRILLKLGGEELSPPADFDPTTTFLVDFGIVFAGPVVVKQNPRGPDDRALGRIWNRRLHGIVGIGIGYALDADGIWREHAFGVLREGVLELTVPKQKYFGLLLIGEAADGYAETLNR